MRALLDLYEATLEPEWMSWAAELQRRQDELFWDQDGGEKGRTIQGFLSLGLTWIHGVSSAGGLVF